MRSDDQERATDAFAPTGKEDETYRKSNRGKESKMPGDSSVRSLLKISLQGSNTAK